MISAAARILRKVGFGPDASFSAVDGSDRATSTRSLVVTGLSRKTKLLFIIDSPTCLLIWERKRSLLLRPLSLCRCTISSDCSLLVAPPSRSHSPGPQRQIHGSLLG